MAQLPDLQKMLILCIIIKSPEEENRFYMERCQFPVQLAFSMIIKKSQGQLNKNIIKNIQSSHMVSSMLHHQDVLFIQSILKY